MWKVCWHYGRSLAIVTTVASMFFGAVSGSAVATASAIGSVVAPEAENKECKKFIALLLQLLAWNIDSPKYSDGYLWCYYRDFNC